MSCFLDILPNLSEDVWIKYSEGMRKSLNTAQTEKIVELVKNIDFISEIKQQKNFFSIGDSESKIYYEMVINDNGRSKAWGNSFDRYAQNAISGDSSFFCIGTDCESKFIKDLTNGSIFCGKFYIHVRCATKLYNEDKKNFKHFKVLFFYEALEYRQNTPEVVYLTSLFQKAVSLQISLYINYIADLNVVKIMQNIPDINGINNYIKFYCNSDGMITEQENEDTVAFTIENTNFDGMYALVWDSNDLVIAAKTEVTEVEFPVFSARREFLYNITKKITVPRIKECRIEAVFRWAVFSLTTQKLGREIGGEISVTM